ncbi:hypothetical protein CRYUN_Cryun39dG0054100 [Craigia yunnanensis]
MSSTRASHCGLRPHSDAVCLTILLRLSEVEGLQIKKDCKWIPVKPLPNAYIVNVGDISEKFKENIHQPLS